MKRKAVVFGVTGQDGSFLTELLLEKDYQVVGVKRRSSVDNTERLTDVLNSPDFTLVEGDVTDTTNINRLIMSYKPNECYNLAAQSHVLTSFDQPDLTFHVNALGVINILESIRTFSPSTRFYQASTSEMFGSNFSHYVDGEDCHHKYQDEKTAFAPQSPYAVAKVAAHHAVQLYRTAYRLFACGGILFNHESERRGHLFVTRKISLWVAGLYHRWLAMAQQAHFGKSLNCNCNAAANSLTDGARRISFPVLNVRTRNVLSKYCELLPPTNNALKLNLGNLKAFRDWGYAKDFVYGMWLMLQQDRPDDYVLATGETHTVADFLDVAFKYIGVDDWKPFVYCNPKFYRPAEVDYLQGDCSKARDKLGWTPLITFEDLVQLMVEYDIQNGEKTSK